MFTISDIDRRYSKPPWLFSFFKNKCDTSSENLEELTVFPAPGDPRRQFVGHFDEASDKHHEMGHQEVAPRHPRLKIAGSVSFGQEYWMPDGLCKLCYECELPFGLFRRKHHCRFCGQIFCHACSSHFVDGKALMLSGMVRACKLCQAQVSTNLLSSSFVLSHSVCLQADHVNIHSPCHAPSEAFLRESSNSHTESSLFLNSAQEQRLACGTEDKNILLSSLGFTRSNWKTSEVVRSPPPRILSLTNCSSKGIHFGCANERILAKGGTYPNHFQAERQVNTASSIMCISHSELLTDKSTIRCSCKLKSGMSFEKSRGESCVSCSHSERNKLDVHHLRRIVERLFHDDMTLQDLSNDKWVRVVYRLVQQVCEWASPRKVNAGDSLDILPFVKFKRIEGGSPFESKYLDGVIFRKQTVHKLMRKSAHRPQILVIADGVEFQRAKSRLASFETLLEQEVKYTEIIVEKIVSLNPDVLLVGQSISRLAQECLQKHNVIAMQHVKRKTLSHVARMTGATIFNSIDHITSMGQLAQKALGVCKQFQVVCCRTAPHWLGPSMQQKFSGRLGLNYQSYVCFTGCPENRGCALVLRGASGPLLKKLTRIMQHTIVVAHHCRLEQSHLENLRAPPSSLPLAEASQLAISQSSILTENRHSTFPPFKKLLESNLSPQTCSLSRKLLLFTSVCMSGQAQLLPAEVKAIIYYSHQDTCLGNYLLDSCFSPNCEHWRDKKAPADVEKLLYHKNGRVRITVSTVDTASKSTILKVAQDSSDHQPLYVNVIRMWTVCRRCAEVLTPVVPISTGAWNMSYGKFLERFFYGRIDARCCEQSEPDFIFSLGKQITRFSFEAVRPYSVCVRRKLPFDHAMYSRELRHKFSRLHLMCLKLFTSFRSRLRKMQTVFDEAVEDCLATKNSIVQCGRMEDGFHESQVTLGVAMQAIKSGIALMAAELRYHSARMDKLLLSEMNKPTTSYSRLNATGACFPSQYRHQIFMRATNWNRRVSLIGQLLDGVCGISQVNRSWVSDGSLSAPDSLNGEVSNIRALLSALEFAQSSRANASCRQKTENEDYTEGLSSRKVGKKCNILPARSISDPPLSDGILTEKLVDSTSCVSWHTKSPQTNMKSTYTWNNDACDQPMICRTQSKQERDSHHRLRSKDDIAVAPLQQTRDTMNDAFLDTSNEFSWTATDDGALFEVTARYDPENNYLTRSQSSERSQLNPSRRTYNISNAFARLLGKDSTEEDPWTVDLGDVAEGRLRLEAGNIAEVVLVHEEQPTTVIAYSLSTSYYKRSIQTHDYHIFQHRFANQTSIWAGPPLLRGRSPKETKNEKSCMELGLGVWSDLSHMRELLSNKAWDCSKTCLAGLAQGLDSRLIAPQKVDCAETHMLRTGGHKLSYAEAGVDTRGEISPTLGASQHLARISESEGPRSMSSPYASQDICKSSNMFRKTCVHGIEWSSASSGGSWEWTKDIEAPKYMPYCEMIMLADSKTHVKHRFADIDKFGTTLCKFVCHSYWASQFAAVRQAFFGNGEDEEIGFLRSLSMARPWNAQGGKSGATFLKTKDGRFVVKQITRTELQMFLEYAPAYFEYLSKVFFHEYPTILVKVLGVYQIGSHNRVSGKRIMEQVVVMQNLFHEHSLTRVFDLKGSTRSRKARVRHHYAIEAVQTEYSDCNFAPSQALVVDSQTVLLDENFIEFSRGCPLPLLDKSKTYFNHAVLNDTLFLSVINVVDYSILVGIDEHECRIVIGIIDYMRQYDIIKKVERMGKSVGMIAGQPEPTVIQPPNYRNRFRDAMERYFLVVPDEWSSFRLQSMYETGVDDSQIPACMRRENEVS